ncbi:hypothetical protein RvVAR0630_07200 [Agrobacterium vitis]|nr:hypothetical protein RvVAR0630_07200 [Agrobacterium vitis]
MHRVGIETFGRVEFQHTIGAQDINGADFGNHIARDLARNTVKTLLRLKGLRHQFAKPLEEDARTCGKVSHRVHAPDNDNPGAKCARR